MKLCALHWALLRGGVMNAGMGGLIPDTRGEMTDRVVSIATSGYRADNYDPLLQAWVNLRIEVLSTIAAVHDLPSPDGSFPCPCCDLNEWFVPRYAHRGDDLIDEAVAATRVSFLRVMHEQH